MSLLSTLVGISAGVFVRTYANAMMKVRLLRSKCRLVACWRRNACQCAAAAAA